MSESTRRLDPAGIAALEDLASVLSQPGTPGERVSTRLRDLANARTATSAIEPAVEPPIEPAIEVRQPTPPEPVPTVANEEAVRPTTPHAPPFVEIDALDNAAAALIDSSIAMLNTLTAQPFSTPTPIAEDVVVPIESLLYRGRAALDRAVEPPRSAAGRRTN